MNANKMATGFLWLLLIALIVIGIGLIPLAWIWALNTLFALGIEYTFWTWLAAWVLGLLLGSGALRRG